MRGQTAPSGFGPQYGCCLETPRRSRPAALLRAKVVYCMPILKRTFQTKAPQRREHGDTSKFAIFQPPTRTPRRSSLQQGNLGKEAEIEPETLHRARRHRTESPHAATMVIRQSSSPSRHARRSERVFDVRQPARYPKVRERNVRRTTQRLAPAALPLAHARATLRVHVRSDISTPRDLFLHNARSVMRYSSHHQPATCRAARTAARRRVRTGPGTRRAL